MKYFLVLVANYLVGSIPSAYLIGRLKGIDIKQHGSGNVGATNAFRVLGKGPGILVLIMDSLKGIIGVFLAREAGGLWFVVPAAFMVMIGHSYSLFLKFKGGKGVATGTGIFLALAPLTVGIELIIFFVIVAISKYVSLGSIVVAATIPITMYFVGDPLPVRILGFLAAALVIYRHIPNIKRIVEGTENKITGRIR